MPSLRAYAPCAGAHRLATPVRRHGMRHATTSGQFYIIYFCILELVYLRLYTLLHNSIKQVPRPSLKANQLVRISNELENAGSRPTKRGGFESLNLAPPKFCSAPRSSRGRRYLEPRSPSAPAPLRTRQGTHPVLFLGDSPSRVLAVT